MSSYCNQADCYAFIPPGMTANPGRLIASVSTSSEVLTLDGHGLATDDPITFRLESGGSMPSPLVVGTTYYAIRVNDSQFSVSTAVGGGAVNLSTAGSNLILIRPLPWATWITQASDTVEQSLPQHVTPITGTIPESVKMFTAVLVAQKALAYAGSSSAVLQPQLEWWASMVSKWSKGQPIRGAVVPASANLAITTTAASNDPRGWVPDGGGLP
jgi:hypothetical protein